MPDTPIKALNSALAKEYAEALLVQHDMRLSLEAMKLWAEKYASVDGDEARIIGGSLFRDAIIQFVGCFDKGAQFHLSAEDIYGLYDRGLESFQWFKDTRDAYAAHRFGAQRQCVIGVVIDSATGGRSLTQHMAVYRGQTKQDGAQLVGFMRTAEKHLNSLIEAFAAKVIEATLAMSPDEIAKLEDGAFHGLGQNEARLSRHGLQRARSNKGRSSTPTS